VACDITCLLIAALYSGGMAQNFVKTTSYDLASKSRPFTITACASSYYSFMTFSVAFDTTEIIEEKKIDVSIGK